MQLKIFAVRDSKGEMYNNPFFKKSEAEAERDFGMLVRDEKSTVNKCPEDFDLYYLGTYDDETGKIKSVGTPQHKIKAINVLKAKKS